MFIRVTTQSILMIAKYVRIIVRDRIIALAIENQEMIVIICEALFTLLQFGF